MQRLATLEISLPLVFYVFRISVRNMTVLLVPVILTYTQHPVFF
jgi:hypothetical protein